jgi:DNA-binding NarL/FixJ family response regulator
MRDETPEVIKDILEFEPQAQFVILANKSQLDEIKGTEALQARVVLVQPAAIETLLETIEQLTLPEKISV